MISLNGKPIFVTYFPDNTSQVWKLQNLPGADEDVIIEWVYSNEGEVMQLAQLVRLLIEAVGGAKIDLDIKYLPYGRQDKTVSNQSTFALHAFASVINNLGFDDVYIRDPHSSVATELIMGAKPYYPKREVQRAFASCRSTVVCYPDAGACNKYLPLYEFPNIYGEKVRETLTGEIKDYRLVGECKGDHVLIVDDICDGGATFCILADKLREAGAATIDLFVTHGIFSKGTRVLREAGIGRIFTADGEYFQPLRVI